jgi:2-C-methyl-D-erythritol 2,4-cyclodiphosphate synthase
MNDESSKRVHAGGSPGFRIGTGYDIHRLVENRPLILGGVTIPFFKGLLGHSDADCLTHAIADSILGACGLPDIGHFFPDSDPQFAGIDSQVILEKCAGRARQCLYSIVNIDAVVIAESPVLAPHLPLIKATLARTLKLSPECLGIKATTHEGIGTLGRGEGIATHAVCLVQRVP